MNLAQNQALKIFLTSIIILFFCIFVIHKYNIKSITDNHLQYSKNIVNESSVSVESHLLQKIKMIRTIAVSPTLVEALEASNDNFGKLTAQQRNMDIKLKNDKWKSIKDINHKFITSYTNNSVSKYIHSLQEAIKGEFGEIFVTNKYGALVSSTAKLTTFDHSYKYWWKGSFNNGDGAVFIDDRGYDESVGGYVLGIAVPIKDRNEIIGILKANLNILGSIDEIITTIKKEDSEQLFLIRSGGLIVFKEGIVPLSKRISNEVLERIENDEQSFILKDDGIYSVSEIGITVDREGYNFGGSFESIDHKKGNTGETWFVVDFHPISHVMKPINSNFKILISIGLLLSIFLAIVSMIIGNRIAKPIKEIIKQTQKITDGNYETEVVINRNDEIGQLALSLNKMTKNLNETTTSLDNLNAEIVVRQNKEKDLLNAAKRWQATFDASQDIIWLLGSDHVIMQSNKKAEEYFNLPLDKIIGKKCYTIVHTTQEPDQDCPYERAKNSLTRESMELNINEKWFEITIDPIADSDDKYVGAVHFIRDITIRKNIQNEISNKTNELEKQFEKSEKQRIANLVILSDLNRSTKKLKTEVSERIQAEEIQKTLFEISNALNITETLAELYGKIRDSLGNVIDTTNFYIALYNEKTNIISFSYYADESHDKKDYLPPSRVFGKGLSEYVISSTKPLYATKLIQDKLAEQNKIELIGTRSEIWLGAPLNVNNQIIGVIAVQSYVDPNLFTEKDLEILTFISEEVARAIEHKQAEEQIKKDLEEKNTLLQELYHRTKNNMQVISSMLRIEARRSDSEVLKASFKEITSKINTMALVHQKLYQAKDLSRIDLSEYIRDLTLLITRGYGLQAENVTFKYEMQNIFVLIDTVMPLGLVLNELITNIFKHAFPKNKKGEISIEMKLDSDDVINIFLSDNGAGIKDNIDLKQVKSMGLQTMYSLVEHQLQGSVEYESENGLKWHIKLKDTINTKRV
jgi:PAS domain S-box-containing protein